MQKQPEPNLRLKKLSAYLNGGTALDLACGLGGNSFFLSRLNYQVEAMDISDVAINFIKEQAAKYNLNIQSHTADLTELHNLRWTHKTFDLIVISYYLDRSLFPIVRSLLKEDGYFYMETFYQSPENGDRKISNQYKLQPKELLSEFGDWTLHYFEENEQEGWQSIFCQKQ
ncbi:class I SAM-dependent methyltransferase [Bacillus sp. FJAT-49705]|uniref:Class I SAM-dependent methyltransferase n=1 Tax=Cytobacillus citreus TaxID=2833586 RepID=A0ABS5NYB4_9BACI|nr:class I SAM-dependent methyltransferase [Cytobacillus citreus]MBS4191869.1 class I SAM-dependent methyltransferase [Cytobacillus citreus]